MKEIYINRTIRLEQGEDGFYRDEHGVIYALPDKKSSKDEKVRYGVGIFSIPEKWLPLDPAEVHDYAYTSPVYQAFNTRYEADLLLQQHLALLGYPVIGRVFKTLSRLFGAKFWENKKTR